MVWRGWGDSHAMKMWTFFFRTFNVDVFRDKLTGKRLLFCFSLLFFFVTCEWIVCVLYIRYEPPDVHIMHTRAGRREMVAFINTPNFSSFSRCSLCFCKGSIMACSIFHSIHWTSFIRIEDGWHLFQLSSVAWSDDCHNWTQKRKFFFQWDKNELCTSNYSQV